MFWIPKGLWPSKDQSRGALILKQPTILQYVTFYYSYIYFEQPPWKESKSDVSLRVPALWVLSQLIM